MLYWLWGKTPGRLNEWYWIPDQLKVSPGFDKIRNDPRFNTLWEKNYLKPLVPFEQLEE